MIDNKKLNIISGWLVFGLSFIVFLLTASRTVNFWDSGDLISCADSLQISHSPGAPLYLLIARFFSFFSINSKYVAFSVNLLSVFSASFTVFFLYHIIQKISLRIFKSQLADLEKSKAAISTGGAVIGSLSFAFSTSFWSSAVKADIFSLYTLFLSIILWCMLKYSETNYVPKKSRWLILCSLLLGLGVCVDFTIIFIIPALCFVFYFDKYKKVNYKMLIKISAISIALPLFLWYSLYIVPVIASKFELLFVNSFKFGYNSGLYCFALVFTGLIVLGIYLSGIKKKPVLNLIITCFAVFVSGSSAYLTVIIRSSSNPPIDQSNPETIFNFISYISQDQYGNYPLIYGPQYNSEIDRKNPYIEGGAIYDTLNNKYSIVAHKPKINYKKGEKRLFPRMWSSQPEHIAAYKEWTGYRSDKIPSFWTNMKFMIRYQFSHEYFRYFMWNFVGRQNDIQSHGGPMYGNWISGINFVDNVRLGNVYDLPPNMKDNKAKDAYYFLPLILGILGMIISYKKDRRYFFIIGLLFIITGFFTAFYLNFHPYQAKERDYLFLGSYCAFSVWVGLGVVWLYEKAKKYRSGNIVSVIILLLCFVAIPGQFLAKNYDNNSYRNNDFTRSYAYNILNSCENNAILFTWGDNETFPLWYLQEVEEIRTDVKVINLSLLNTDWYIDQIRKDTKNSKGILLGIDKSKYISGQREILLVNDIPSAFSEDIYFENVKEVNEDYTFIFNSLVQTLKDNGFDKTHSQEFNNFFNFYSRVQPITTNPSFKDFQTVITSLNDEEYRKEFGLTEQQAHEAVTNLNRFIFKQQNYPIPLNAVLNFVFSDIEDTKIETHLYNYPVDFFPTNKLMLRINDTQIKDNFNLTSGQENNITSRMTWSLNRESITKSDLIVLEIILSNMWERPVYFSSTMNKKYFLGLDDYLYLEGFAYRLIPLNPEFADKENIKVNNDIMYKNLSQNFNWGNLNDKSFYLDENSRNNLSNIRNHYSYFAEGLYIEGKTEESENVLDWCVELIPDVILNYDYYTIGIVKGYYKINKKVKAKEIAQILAENALKELEYYSRFSIPQQAILEVYKQRALLSVDELYNLANYYIHTDYIPEITEIYNEALRLYHNSR